jgi:NADP-dependent 3-hydroxy acid dehydrogenase YdfG
MPTLAQQTFIVTGAAGSIAGSIVDALAAAGARLALVDHESPRLAERARAHGALEFPADLLSPAGAAEMIAGVTAALGPVDGLVHTVGGFAWGPVHEATADVYDRMFDLNVRTLFNAVRAVLPDMRARGRGFIAGISSQPGWSGASPNTALYGAAKAAVATLLRSLDGELTGTAIRVAILYPMGAVDTPANRRDMPEVSPDTLIDPAELGAAIRFAAERSPRGRVTEIPVYPPR